ncbi:hypothetical protein ACEXOS_001660 [Herbiconiux sp. P16]|uniref:hypothetical protein n=1 Tax=Herbiconiux wuyangfengii TaxID=3342794 RepID=UPI0035BB77EF
MLQVTTPTPAPTPTPASASAPRSDERRSSDTRPWRLSPRLRKLLLLTHIASGGVWLGIDVVLGVLVVTALTAGATTAGATTTAALAVGIAAFATWPIVAAGSLSLVTGVLLGLGSKFGLVRYRWVLVKLALTVVLLALVLVVLLPGILELGSDASAALDPGDRGTGATGAAFAISGQLLFPPIVSSTALIFAMTLSVLKPWGRTRRADPRATPSSSYTPSSSSSSSSSATGSTT